MKTMENLVSNVLTEVSEQPTKESPINIKDWATWLSLKIVNPKIEELVASCSRFIQAFDAKENPRWISLLGNAGTGKTHCGKKMWDTMEKNYQWHNFRYFQDMVYWPSLIQDLRGADRGDGTWNRFTEMRSWPVLFLDDIGAERDTTGFATEQLNTILGCRVNRWTIITSNLMLGQLAEIEPRIADRMIREKGNQVVELNCKSYALTKATL